MSCEFCPSGGGGCAVCDPAAGDDRRINCAECDGTGVGDKAGNSCYACGGSGVGPDQGGRRAAVGVMPDDPEFCASVCHPAAARLRGRPVPVTIFVAWEWWGVEVSGPAADCLEYLAGREVPASARPAFSKRLRKGVRS